MALVTALGRAISAEVLIVPHHGSKTSSSAAFLDAVGPRVAVVQAGYRNRFGHPAPEVMARYAERGIAVIDSPGCGAWRFGPDGESCWRTVAQRYWHHRPGVTRDNGLEVAKPSAARAPSVTPESDANP
jgi:competence protein ComEC